MSKIRVLIIGSSVRPGCMMDRVLKLVASQLKMKDVEFQVLDPREWKLPLIENPLQFYPDRTKAPKEVIDLNAVVEKADAYLVVTAEYNRCIPPALTNMLDHVSPVYFSMKPAGIISYSMGMSGGSNSNAQVRQLLSELGCLVVPHFMTIPKIQNQISDQGETNHSNLTLEMNFIMDQILYVVEAKKCLEQHEEKTSVPAPHPCFA